MKIIVDEVPKMAYKCLFSNYDYGYHQCQLTKADCYLDCNKRCELLLSIKQMKAGGENEID